MTYVSYIYWQGIDAVGKQKNQYTTCTALSDTCISAIRTVFFGDVSIAQVVEVTHSAVPDGVVVVSSRIPHRSKFFRHLPA